MKIFGFIAVSAITCISTITAGNVASATGTLSLASNRYYAENDSVAYGEEYTVSPDTMADEEIVLTRYDIYDVYMEYDTSDLSQLIIEKDDEYAMYVLGVRWLFEAENDDDLYDAFVLLSVAAQRGNSDAAYMLGRTILEGTDTLDPEARETALGLLRQAVEMNNEMAIDYVREMNIVL